MIAWTTLAYRDLKIRRLEPGILEIVMGEEGGKLSTATARLHAELARIWLDVDRDPETRVAILRGAGKGFSGGGDLAMVEQITTDFAARARVWREARDLVYNVINCSKMVVSAMHGPAVGAGLVAGLLADVSIAAKNARIIDGHTRLGVAAGDHAAIVWPLLCGMAKAKYYLLTCEQISGEEAERIGLVSLCCEEAELQAKALEVARKLAAGAQTALRWTKYSLNNWLRMAGPSFDASLALEFRRLQRARGEGRHRLPPREEESLLSPAAGGLLAVADEVQRVAGVGGGLAQPHFARRAWQRGLFGVAAQQPLQVARDRFDVGPHPAHVGKQHADRNVDQRRVGVIAQVRHVLDRGQDIVTARARRDRFEPQDDGCLRAGDSGEQLGKLLRGYLQHCGPPEVETGPEDVDA